jgi:hypothetical protein
MATAPPTDNRARPAKPQPLVPPDERFWQRYSPHHELPLSGAGSFAVHALVFGLLLLSGYLALAYFNKAARSLPVEAVRLETGGGGGRPTGVEGGSGTPTAPKEVGPDDAQPPKDPGTAPPEKRPDLKVQGPKTETFPDPAAMRYVTQADTDAMRAFHRLKDANVRIRLPDGPDNPGPKGKAGPGEGGGQGDGKGPGTGSGRGEGGGKLTQREKRMLRWSMLFNTNSGPDYVDQLRHLHAILAIPVAETEAGKDYRLVRDLSRRPAQLLKEDLSKIQRIYWIDDKPDSVQQVMATLGLQLMPSHFVAFMPEDLENKLFQLEKARLNKDYPGRTEDDIAETKFKIKRGSYEPEIISVRVK